MDKDMLSDAQAKEAIAKGMPLPRGSSRNLTASEQAVADVLQRLAAVGGDVAKLSPLDAANYAIYRDRGEIKALTGDEETAEEKIARGLLEAEAKRDDAAAEAFKVLEDLAVKALAARRKAEWSDFRTKRAAAAVTKNLAAQFEKAEVEFSRIHLSKVSSELRELANGHLAELKKAFGEPFKEIG